MAIPDTRALRQFPVTWPLYRQHQRRSEIDQILRLHDQGYFSKSAGLVDEMMTDDRIAGVTDQRAAALLSKPFEFRPAGPGQPALDMKELFGGDGQDVQGLWREMVSTPGLREIMTWGWFLGIGVAEIVWSRNPKAPIGKKWMPRLVPYHPGYIRWDWGLARFVLNTPDNNQIVLPRPDEQPSGDGRWFVYCPWGVRGGWRRALVRSLADKYIQRKWNERDWARYCEKNGLSIMVAKVPMGESDGLERQRFFDSLQDMGSETVVMAPQGAAGEPSYDLDLREPTAQTWQAFQAWKTALDDDIAIRIVGQLDTTATKSGGVGNTGNRNQGDVAANILGEDAEIGPLLRQQVFAWHVEYNNGDRSLTPYCEFQIDPPEDEKSEGEGQAARAAAVNGWKLAGADIDVNAEAEKAGMILVPPELRSLPGEEDAPDPEDPGSGGDSGAASSDSSPDSPDNAPAPDGGGVAPAVKTVPRGAPARTKLRAFPQAVRKTYDYQGLPIAVEHEAGSLRTFIGPDGSGGQAEVKHDYGYIDGYLGEDGDELDCYVGPDQDAPEVHVIHQLKAPAFRAHDESKVMLGFADPAAARAAYLANRGEPQAFGGMTTLPIDRFKEKLRRRGPEATTKIRARAETAGAVALGAPKVIVGHSAASTYVDKLVDKAKRDGAEDLRPFLDKLLKAVADGTDWEDVKARSLQLMKSSKSQNATTTIMRARILARLMGRGAILKKHGVG